jgi:hypothetical protein
MLSFYFVDYNFRGLHNTLRMSPAMAAGITHALRDVEWIVSIVDATVPKAASASS